MGERGVGMMLLLLLLLRADGCTTGWAFPVATGTGDVYRLSLPGGAALPSDWVIEFSDPVFGNRWAADEVSLLVEGRSCPAVTTSQHDRRWVYADPSAWLPAVGWGRGACSGEADMAPIGCSSVAQLPLSPCDGACPGGCGDNGRCEVRACCWLGLAAAWSFPFCPASIRACRWCVCVCVCVCSAVLCCAALGSAPRPFTVGLLGCGAHTPGHPVPCLLAVRERALRVQGGLFRAALRGGCVRLRSLRGARALRKHLPGCVA